MSLVYAFAQGDASAFDTLYSRHKDRLFSSLFHQLASNQQAAEEVAQEVWMAVIKGAASFDAKDIDMASEAQQDASKSNAFVRWLFAIAHRRTADYWRRHYRQQGEEVHDLDSIEVRDGVGSEDGNEPEQQRLVQELRQCLMKLPEEQRRCFILREEGFSYQEVAEITGTGVETVKSRLRYARNTLKQRLGGEV